MLEPREKDPHSTASRTAERRTDILPIEEERGGAGLWWLLGHTPFGDAVRASATNVDLARLTGISPKLVSTAVWTIAGFLSAVAVVLTASDQGSTDLVHIGRLSDRKR